MDYMISRCADSDTGVTSSCSDSSEDFDNADWGVLLNNRYTDIHGIKCGCKDYACNHPKG